MMETAVQFAGLTKDYSFGFWGRKQRALNALTLDVPRGSIFGFLGANGAGKTTGIKILMGLQFPTAGSVKVFGQSPQLPETKARMGYLPERPYFHDGMNADNFLNFHRDLFGKTIAGKKGLSNSELLSLVGLSNVRGKRIKDFSKGMSQRIGIAQALVNDPDLVVLDEPMSGLDPVGRREVRDLILSLNRMGKTIFFSTHILSDVESLCHRFAFLDKGVLKLSGSLDELRRDASGAQELLFSGLDSGAISRSRHLSGAVASGGRFLLHCGGEPEARAAIEEIWGAGGRLISCQPEQKSLENLLFGEEK